MRILLTLLLLFSPIAHALSLGEQEVIIKGVIKAAQARGYTADEIVLTIRSNVFEVDEFMMCFYLPKWKECK